MIQKTYKHLTKHSSALNRAFSDNFGKMIAGEYPSYQADYSKVILSRGSFLLPEFILVASLLEGTLSFIWTTDAFIKQGMKVYLAVYSEELNTWRFDVDNTAYSEGTCTLELSDFSGKVVHSYIGFMSEDYNTVSNSLYTGMVNIL